MTQSALDYTPAWWLEFSTAVHDFYEVEGDAEKHLFSLVQRAFDDETTDAERDRAYAVTFRKRLLEWVYMTMRNSLRAAYLARCLRGEALMQDFKEAIAKKRIANDLLRDVGALLVEASREEDVRRGLFNALPRRVF